jgi:histidyl-tRNA synthetase
MTHLDEESAKHFDAFKAYLECMDIPYVINTRLVRGLDYYNRAVFEVFRRLVESSSNWSLCCVK